MPLPIDDAGDRPVTKPTDEIEITPEMVEAAGRLHCRMAQGALGMEAGWPKPIAGLVHDSPPALARGRPQRKKTHELESSF